MRDWPKALAGCRDVTNLRSAIYELSTEFGGIAHMDILTMKQPRKRQALCFLQLKSAAREPQLMANLGATRFANELLFVVDLPVEHANIAEQPEDRAYDQIDRDAVVQQRAEHDRLENARERRFWFSPARWGGTLLVAARRALHQEVGQPDNRLVP